MKITAIERQQDELARITAYCQLLGQLCELSPHAEPIPLENLEQIFKDIATVCSQINLKITFSR